jgi:uncharacterized cysteine cluster protein YcgN (CxxCxxCC family)
MYTLRVNGRPVAIRELACPYLEETSRDRYDCSCYERRFDQAPWCLTIPEARRQPVLAPDCPYRDDDAFPAADAPQRLHPRLVQRIKAQVQATLDAHGLPPWLRDQDLPSWLEALDPPPDP